MLPVRARVMVKADVAGAVAAALPDAPFVIAIGLLRLTRDSLGNVSPLFLVYNPSCKEVTRVDYSHEMAA